MTGAASLTSGPGVYEDRDHRSPTAEPRGEERRAGRRRAPRVLSRHVLSGPQTVEAYLRASSPPRYMQRLREIEIEFQRHRRRLDDAYRSLAEHCRGDRALFARRWLDEAAGWRFGTLNQLIREHNEWYPVEANLPMDPRTRDYVPIRGASYRRVELGPEWVLEHFPATGRGPATPAVPRRSPREPIA